MSEYQPELGQMIFGQPFKRFDCPRHVEAALEMIRQELERVRSNLAQDRVADPFSNSGEVFVEPALPFEVHAYSWSDEEQPFNFKCGDIEVSWYKYLGRGMSCSRELTPADSAALLDTCIDALRAWERAKDNEGSAA